ncbi:MAG: hypothetical protein AAGA56_11235, partial [Myxococcota bacterium]
MYTESPDLPGLPSGLMVTDHEIVWTRKVLEVEAGVIRVAELSVKMPETWTEALSETRPRRLRVERKHGQFSVTDLAGKPVSPPYAAEVLPWIEGPRPQPRGKVFSIVAEVEPEFLFPPDEWDGKVPTIQAPEARVVGIIGEAVELTGHAALVWPEAKLNQGRVDCTVRLWRRGGVPIRQRCVFESRESSSNGATVVDRSTVDFVRRGPHLPAVPDLPPPRQGYPEA